MALGLPPTRNKGVDDVCQSHRRQKRTRDDTTESPPKTESKRSKAMPSPSPTREDFANAWQTAEDMHGQLMTPYHPMRGSEVHFTAVDYNSPASTVDAEPVSPKFICSQTPMPMELTDNGQDESDRAVNDFMFNPKIDWSTSTPFAEFPESPSPATSFRQDSFSHPSAWVDMVCNRPLVSPLGAPPGPPSSTHAVFGSPVHHSPMQIHGDFSWCYCGACRSGNPHGFHHHRHASGWRRASSMTLPACYHDHMYSPCHDTFITPLSAPLPPQSPVCHPHMQQEQMYTVPQTPPASVMPQVFQTYPHQANPHVALRWPTTPGMNAGEGAWNRQLPLRDENPQHVHDSSATVPADNQGPPQATGADSQSWMQHLDAMALDASHWHI